MLIDINDNFCLENMEITKYFLKIQPVFLTKRLLILMVKLQYH